MYMLIYYSMSGHRVVNSPSSHMYCATKFAVRAITEGLRNELVAAKSHIRVTVGDLFAMSIFGTPIFCVEQE